MNEIENEIIQDIKYIDNELIVEDNYDPANYLFYQDTSGKHITKYLCLQIQYDNKEEFIDEYTKKEQCLSLDYVTFNFTNTSFSFTIMTINDLVLFSFIDDGEILFDNNILFIKIPIYKFTKKDRFFYSFRNENIKCFFIKDTISKNNNMKINNTCEFYPISTNIYNCGYHAMKKGNKKTMFGIFGKLNGIMIDNKYMIIESVIIKSNNESYTYDIINVYYDQYVFYIVSFIDDIYDEKSFKNFVKLEDNDYDQILDKGIIIDDINIIFYNECNDLSFFGYNIEKFE